MGGYFKEIIYRFWKGVLMGVQENLALLQFMFDEMNASFESA